MGNRKKETPFRKAKTKKESRDRSFYISEKASRTLDNIAHLTSRSRSSIVALMIERWGEAIIRDSSILNSPAEESREAGMEGTI